MLWISLSRYCMVLTFFLALPACVLCQVQNGQFTGVIGDPTGANVASARILIKNLETGYEMVVHSNEVGIFAAQGADGRSLQTDGGSCWI